MKLDVLTSRTTGEVGLHEEIPDEELWEDGELNERQLSWKLFHRVIEVGDWKIVRRIDESE
tara:strand:+ start:435 stop:617 length:183 start_codon:yes stop_codon:yes gene_type:complete